MANYKTARIIPVALTLIIIAIAVAALVSLVRVIFFSGNTTISQVDVSKESLLSTSANRAVRMTVRGKIVADETFRSYQIKITPNERKLTTYKGYLNQQIGDISLGNNIPAYGQFVYALYRADLTKGTELTGNKNDLRGICATGFVYEFQILESDALVKQLWTSSCSDSRGSLNAETDQLTKLFIAQIPDARSLIGKLWQ